MRDALRCWLAGEAELACDKLATGLGVTGPVSSLHPLRGIRTRQCKSRAAGAHAARTAAATECILRWCRSACGTPGPRRRDSTEAAMPPSVHELGRPKRKGMRNKPRLAHWSLRPSLET